MIRLLLVFVAIVCVLWLVGWVLAHLGLALLAGAGLALAGRQLRRNRG